MINLLKNILNSQDSDQEKEDNKNLELLCGLMIEAAYTDGRIDESELQNIKSSLINVFGEEPNNVELVLDAAIKNKNNTKSLHYYTSFINKNFSEENKLILIEVLLEDLPVYFIFLMLNLEMLKKGL